MPDRPLSPATVAVTAGRPPRAPDAPLNAPMVLTSTYHAPGEVGYGRYGNPTWSAFEEVLGGLEGGPAVAFASGTAAVDAVLRLVPAGGRIVASRHLYAGSTLLLDELDGGSAVEVQRLDVTDTDGLTAAARGADLVWLESPTNPLLDEAELPRIAAACREHATLLAVDNTFATPLLQRPLELGADIVVHSATKYLSGHSDVLLGAVVTREDPLAARFRQYRSSRGAVPGPVETWLALRGLRTLHLRIERAQTNARELAARLGAHAAVTRVRYPGYGGIVSIEVTGGAAAADAVVAALQVWVHATSLGGVESSLERRRRWAFESADVPESLLRLSVGVEDVEDLWDDLAQALGAASPPGSSDA